MQGGASLKGCDADRVKQRQASRTAIFVCQGRAVAAATGAPLPFHDDIASQLLSQEERAEVERACATEPPTTWRDRLEWKRLRSCAETMIPCTIAIDDAVARAEKPQLVVLGTGLDDRPWRMERLCTVTVFAVDHPTSQTDLRRRTSGLHLVCNQLELIPVVFGHDPLATALARAGHDATTPTTWLWEGAVPYLAEQQVHDILAVVSARSAPGSILVTSYQERSMAARAGRRLSRLISRAAGREDPLTAEPWGSLWTTGSMAAALARHGYLVQSDDNLLAIAERIGSTTAHRRSLASRRVVVAARRSRSRPSRASDGRR
jgi:methyltransferase (TIGR00027 family)